MTRTATPMVYNSSWCLFISCEGKGWKGTGGDRGGWKIGLEWGQRPGVVLVPTLMQWTGFLLDGCELVKSKCALFTFDLLRFLAWVTYLMFYLEHKQRRDKNGVDVIGFFLSWNTLRMIKFRMRWDNFSLADMHPSSCMDACVLFSV